MGSSTRIKDIPDEELLHDLRIAYGDLCFVLARVIAIRRRIDPTESKVNALGWTLGYAENQLSEKIMSQADTV
jgi:hypothetical protein